MELRSAFRDVLTSWVCLKDFGRTWQGGDWLLAAFGRELVSFGGCWIKTLEITSDAAVEFRGKGEGRGGTLNAPMVSNSDV
jgi:hypothetical protein